MKKKRFVIARLFVSAVLLAVILAACSFSTAGSQGNPQPAVTETPTITPTIVWFPPTATLAPQPTTTPVLEQELKPGVGELRFTDDFRTGENWTRESSLRGNIVPGDGKLTLSVLESKAELSAIRKDTVVENFYAEATVKVNLCQGDDLVGVIFRTNGATSYYRYMVDCNGRVTAQVVIGGTPTAMYDWVPSGELVSGLPMEFKMGVWASKDVMRFFLNDQFQFEVERSTFVFGGIGFYARATGEPSLSVSIDELSVYDVAASAAVTLTPQVVPPTLTPEG